MRRKDQDSGQEPDESRTPRGLPTSYSGREWLFLRRLGVCLATVRREKGLSQAKLAQKAGISRIHLQNIEGGMANPSMITAWMLAEALSVNLVDLLAFSPPDEKEIARPPRRRAPARTKS